MEILIGDQYNYMEKINRFYGDSYMNFTEYNQ